MKFLILLLAATAVFAVENYDGPEYAPIDNSKIVPIFEIPGFWDGREKLPSFTNVRQSRRIVGGTEVVPNSHPYQIVQHPNFPTGATSICGGSILTPLSILTAVHCNDGFPSTLVIAGAHNRLTIEPNQQRRTVLAENYRMHPNYNPSNLNNDIAILILPSALTYTAAVQPTRLPTDFSNELFVGETARSTGWGLTDTGLLSTVLRKSYASVITNAECSAVYGTSWVIPSVICTSFPGPSICSGDSGGVLSVPRAGDARPVQIGITAFGGTCGSTPGGFVRVTSFLSWISANQV